MDKRTADALEASIEHWRKNVAAETPDDVSIKGDDCALCQTFFLNAGANDYCVGCPVRTRAGRVFCDNTPYVSAGYACDEWLESDTDEDRDAWRLAAQAELDFLISLREPSTVVNVPTTKQAVIVNEYEALVAALIAARHQVNLFARPDDEIAQTVLHVIDAALASAEAPQPGATAQLRGAAVDIDQFIDRQGITP